jgi:hypothetical protein
MRHLTRARALRGAVGIASLSLLTLALTAGPARAAAAASGEGFFGLSAPELLRMSSRGDAAGLERHLAQIEAAGVKHVRVNVSWADWDAFVSRGYHPWRELDTFVTALAEHDLTMLPVPRGAPAWARAYNKLTCPDGDRSAIGHWAFDAYARFVAAITDRYGPGGAFWRWFSELPARPITRIELWNEPNWTAFWCPAPDPERFAKMIDGAARASKAANPAVETVFGGLVSIKHWHYFINGKVRGMPADVFLNRALTARPRLAEVIDSVGIHLYEPTVAGQLERLAWMRGAIAGAGLGASEVAITEFGWNRLELGQAQIAANYSGFVDAIGRNEDCRIDSIAAHSWYTAEGSSTDLEQWWGIASPFDATMYPSGVAYAEQIGLLSAGVDTMARSPICPA